MGTFQTVAVARGSQCLAVAVVIMLAACGRVADQAATAPAATASAMADVGGCSITRPPNRPFVPPRASGARLGVGTLRRILVRDPRAVDSASAGRDLERASLSRRRDRPEGLLVEPRLRLAEPTDCYRGAHRWIRPAASRLDRN